MRILGLTVGRNEANRYLLPMMRYMSTILDEHFYYDDQSTDDSVAVAYRCGAVVYERTSSSPAFMEDEGAFRAAAWSAFERTLYPRLGDWVLVIDCDEVLVSQQVWVREALEDVITRAGARSIMVAITEVFGFNVNGTPMVRTDRLWGTICAPRLFRYQPEATFAFGPFGVPAVPTYVQSGPYDTTEDIRLLHYGYAEEQDQKIKYERYHGQPGHSSAHVESILAPDQVLEPFGGWHPVEMRSWKL